MQLSQEKKIHRDLTTTSSTTRRSRAKSTQLWTTLCSSSCNGEDYDLSSRGRSNQESEKHRTLLVNQGVKQVGGEHANASSRESKKKIQKAERSLMTPLGSRWQLSSCKWIQLRFTTEFASVFDVVCPSLSGSGKGRYDSEHSESQPTRVRRFPELTEATLSVIMYALGAILFAMDGLLWPAMGGP